MKRKGRSRTSRNTLGPLAGLLAPLHRGKKGAGDGNQTRAVSLGSVWIAPRTGAEQGFGPVAGDRG